MTTHPWIERTSPKGTLFVGRCQACGKEGLDWDGGKEECPNPSGMTREEALMGAIEEKPT